MEQQQQQQRPPSPPWSDGSSSSNNNGLHHRANRVIDIETTKPLSAAHPIFPHLDLLEQRLKAFYHITGLRNVDQLYFDMIADELDNQHGRFNTDAAKSKIYWLKNDHPYWLVLDKLYGNACVAVYNRISASVAFIAIRAEEMHLFVTKLWSMLHEYGRVRRLRLRDETDD